MRSLLHRWRGLPGPTPSELKPRRTPICGATSGTLLGCPPSSPSTPARLPVRRSSTCSGVFAEFETNLRRERQLEGIAEAKKAGVYKGGKPRIDREAVHSLHRDGKGPTEIAKALGISRMHAYRLIRAMEAVA